MAVKLGCTKGRSGRPSKRLNVGSSREPVAFLRAVMRDADASPELRVRAV